MSATVTETIDALNGWFHTRFLQLESFGEEMLSTLRCDSAGRVEQGDGMRRRLKSVAVRMLAEDETLDGCGLIFAHSAVAADSGNLEWWVREDESRFARYSFGVVPGADRYYDYEHLEWFTRPYLQGLPTLFGPYIDYLGVESYVVTLTLPAEIDGVRIGAVGNDIQVSDLEAALLPTLLAAPTDMAVVGSHGHVIAGNSSRFLPGEYIDPQTPGLTRVELTPATAGVVLVYAAA